MSLSELVASRAIGQFPLSIATSLAIESVCGIHPEKPIHPPPILGFQEFWVNVRTLFRNFTGSIEPGALYTLNASHAWEAITHEMQVIQEIISEHTSNRCRIVYYFSNYRGMESKYKHAVIRRDSTEKQKEYTAFQNAVMKGLLESHHGMITGFDLKIHPHGVPAKTLILTHYPYDLLSSKAFNGFTLVESHTGTLKEKAQWYTKYLKGSELAQIPFREDFIQVFGDKEHFRPMDVRLQRELLEVAQRYKWSQVSTRDTISYSIDQIKNPMSRELLKSILV